MESGITLAESSYKQRDTLPTVLQAYSDHSESVGFREHLG
jgi:hypothetical protein